MKKTITLLGKEAELYFLARCRCKAFYKIEEGAQSIIDLQKSATRVGPEIKRRLIETETNVVRLIGGLR